MTEQTQTTAQRIQDMLDMNFNFYPGPPGVTAKTIAAEIERLTAEVASKQETIDMLLEDERDAFRHERAQLETQLAKARAEVARREADLSTARITITEVESERNGANAFLDEVAFILQMPTAYMGGVNGWAEVKMQGLAEARAEVATLTLKLANARLNLKHCSEEVDKRDECAGQLGEARAEVERLRPAAEAWEAQEAWIECQDHNGSEPYAVYMAMCDAAARARAAKERKP